MTLRMCCAVFVAFLVAAVTADNKIDPNTLINVFGYAPGSIDPVLGASNLQAKAVTPSSATLVDPDYWDSDDEFTHSVVDYDKFDWIITKRVAATSNENFLISPLGLKLALAILTEAATGATQAELSSVLGFDLDRNIVRRKFASIIDSLKKESPEYILNLGSRVYIGGNAEPRQRFAAIAQEFYKTELRKTNFNEPAIAAKDINDWVSNITQGRIPNLVKEADVRNLVVMVINALFFKGTWRHQFAPNATKPAPFYVAPTQQSVANFMNVKDNFFYAESTKYDAKILRMPYKGNKFAMYIIVPNSLTGLPRVMNGLNDLRMEIGNLKEQMVDVTMPKFKFEYTSQLDGVLRELGVRQVFEDTASLPGIARGQLLEQRLYVSKIVQHTGMEVNELGSVAYSATEIALVNKFGEGDTSYEVNANRPFLFYIQDEPTRQLLFTGRVSDPVREDGAFKH